MLPTKLFRVDVNIRHKKANLIEILIIFHVQNENKKEKKTTTNLVDLQLQLILTDSSKQHKDLIETCN